MLDGVLVLIVCMWYNCCYYWCQVIKYKMKVINGNLKLDYIMMFFLISMIVAVVMLQV